MNIIFVDNKKNSSDLGYGIQFTLLIRELLLFYFSKYIYRVRITDLCMILCKRPSAC